MLYKYKNEENNIYNNNDTLLQGSNILKLINNIAFMFEIKGLNNHEYNEVLPSIQLTQLILLYESQIRCVVQYVI